MSMKLSDDEIAAMEGLPYMHRCLYIFGIRQHMDYETGITGIKRGISWQSLREEIYVEPHQGRVNSGSPSKDQVIRAAEFLEKLGIIINMSEGMRLIFKCVLATRDKSVQNKPATNPLRKPATRKANNGEPFSNKPAIPKTAKPAIPPVSGYISNKLDIYFDQFWKVYPRKVNKKKARDVWIKNELDLVIDQVLADIAERKKGDVNWIEGNQYVPHPVTYLNQERWTDEEKSPKPAQQTGITRGNSHADDKRLLKQRRAEIDRELEEDYERAVSIFNS